MAVAVQDKQAQRPMLLAADRRPYRCGGHRPDADGRQRDCNRRVADVEGSGTLLVTCERCGQEHAFALQVSSQRVTYQTVVALLALVAHLSYDDDAAP